MVSVLLGVLLGALALLRSSTAEPCPGRLECAIRRREYCPSGSSDCGPCLSGHVQDAKGNCEMEHKLHSEMSHRVPVPIINEDIDRLAAALANQHNQPNDLQLAVKESAGRQSNPKEEAPSGVKSNTAEPGFTTSTVTNTPNKFVIVKGGPQGTFVPVSDALLLALIIVCTVAGISGLIVAGICWCRIQRELKLTQKADYQVYGMTAPTDKSLNGDKKLAQSAQMYHYQHQKQQMISMEKNKDESKVADSATESDGENEDGDFTVYECPGLAPTGEMEVKNPLFDDSSLHHSTSKTHQ